MLPIKEIKNLITTGACDDEISGLYQCSHKDLGKYKSRIYHVIEKFQSSFDKDDSSPAAFFSSPGRAELSGNHTDHQKGKVLTATVTLDTLGCAGVRNDDTIKIISEGYGEFTLNINELEPREDEKNTAPALIRGVLSFFKNSGCDFSGFEAYIISDVPGGSGLSSSASFSVLIAVMLNHLFCKDGLDIYSISSAAKYAENVFFGKPCGLMDQSAVALGGINVIDFSLNPPAYHTVNFSFEDAGYHIYITDTGSEHSALSKDFDAIPGEMFAVAKALGGECLGDVNEEDFLRNIPRIRRISGDRSVLRALHWFEEVRRVATQGEALKRGDISEFLKLARESGRSSFMYLQNVSSYCDPAYQPVALTLALADKLLGKRGAFRVHGGGFAGTVIAFVPEKISEEFRSKMNALLESDACTRIRIRPTGAGRIFSY